MLRAGIRGAFSAARWDSTTASGTLRLAGFKCLVLMSSEAYGFTRKNIPYRLFVLCQGYCHQLPEWMGPGDEVEAGRPYFLSLGPVLAFKAFACDLQSLQGS